MDHRWCPVISYMFNHELDNDYERVQVSHQFHNYMESKIRENFSKIDFQYLIQFPTTFALAYKLLVIGI